MGQIIPVDFAVARHYRDLLNDAMALHSEGMPLAVNEIVEEIRNNGFNPKWFAPEKVLRHKWRGESQILRVDFRKKLNDKVQVYRKAIEKLMGLDLTPDELEYRLLKLMAKAKRDHVDLHKLT